jgi:hypothetical protein
MGTPDLQGTLGTFSFYTANPGEISREVPGGRIVRVTASGNRTVLQIQGPPNSLRKSHPSTTADLVVDTDPDQPVARLALGDTLTVLRQGEWGPWLVAEFPLVRGVVNVRGMFRVYLKQVHPWLELYVSPTNADPRSPELPISVPPGYSRAIAAGIGPFYTQGIAEDTAALRQDVFTMPEYLAQAKLVLDDERKLLRYSIDNYRGGLLFVYFSAIDQNSHILWGRYEEELSRVYREIDDVVGEVIEKASGADLFVMSDHGFTSFDRAVNLNDWLAREGLLTRTESLGIDWPHTQAYAMGLNGVYVNLAGREKNGIVPASLRQSTLDKIRDQLLALRDPWNGRVVVESVSIEPPDRANAATTPDMIVGYAPGYRVSWETALGGAPSPMIYDNIDAWIGDHCIDAADVPGVLFSSRKIAADQPVIRDLTVTILRLFGASPGPGMVGKNVL